MSCSKPDDVPEPPEAAPAPAPPPKDVAYPITSTNVVVQKADIPTVSAQKRVEADFNLDSLQDVALVEEDAEGSSTISIYLRSQQDDLREAFYKAGGIRMHGDFRVTALMSTRGATHTDLIVMQLYHDESKEMVHFRSTGTEFREISREKMN